MDLKDEARKLETVTIAESSTRACHAKLRNFSFMSHTHHPIFFVIFIYKTLSGQKIILSFY